MYGAWWNQVKLPRNKKIKHRLQLQLQATERLEKSCVRVNVLAEAEIISSEEEDDRNPVQCCILVLCALFVHIHTTTQIHHASFLYASSKIHRNGVIVLQLPLTDTRTQLHEQARKTSRMRMTRLYIHIHTHTTKRPTIGYQAAFTLIRRRCHVCITKNQMCIHTHTITTGEKKIYEQSVSNIEVWWERVVFFAAIIFFWCTAFSRTIFSKRLWFAIVCFVQLDTFFQFFQFG